MERKKSSHKSQKLTSGATLKPGNLTILNIYSTSDPHNKLLTITFNHVRMTRKIVSIQKSKLIFRSFATQNVKPQEEWNHNPSAFC